MRDIRRVIEFVKAVSFQEVVVQEEIVVRSENRGNKTIQVTTAAYNDKEEKVEDAFFEINGERYDSLGPSYTDDDIWKIIDEMRELKEYT